jgi:type I restriction enzyme S subunit
MNTKGLTERDICTKRITPALVGAGWDLESQIREEVSFTAARSILVKRRRCIPFRKARNLYPSFFPHPDFGGKRWIVGDMDGSVVLCDELEAAQTRREQRRDRLVSASLHRLTDAAGDPDSGNDFKPAARFYLNHLPKLTVRPEHVQQLRRAILDLAVRGLLVSQDAGDEPAGVLLERIRAERARLVEAGVIRKTKPLEPIEAGEVPYVLPKNWCWVRISDVAIIRLGKMLDKAKNKGDRKPYLRNVNVRWFGFYLSDLLEMRFEEDELEKVSLKVGTVLVCEGGEPGRAAVWDSRATDVYFQKAIHRVRLLGGIVPIYFARVLYQDAVSGRLRKNFTGVTIQHLTARGLLGYSFPLPPVGEQHRIVARIDELFAVCKELEAKQALISSTGGQLIETSLLGFHKISDFLVNFDVVWGPLGPIEEGKCFYKGENWKFLLLTGLTSQSRNRYIMSFLKFATKQKLLIYSISIAKR